MSVSEKNILMMRKPEHDAPLDLLVRGEKNTLDNLCLKTLSHKRK
jgi:hypothetical protein